MTSGNATRLGAIAAMLAALLTQVACAGDENALGSGVGVDQTTQALTSGQLRSANGTYGAACRSHAGASWSVEIAVGAPLDNAPLAVVLNDVACVLTLTSLHTDAGIVAAAPAMVLTTSYHVTPSSFGTFYANAKLSAVTYDADFVLTILFSNDPALAVADNTASLIEVHATAVAAGDVQAPNYTLSVAGLIVRTDVGDVVQTVTGTANLTAGTVPVLGQQYVVVNAAGLLTYAAIDAAFIAGTKAPLVLAIPAVDFTLVGADLTAGTTVRTLIVANTVTGVASYEAFAITFHPAP